MKTQARTYGRAAGFAGVTATLLPLYLARMRLARARGEAERPLRDAWIHRWTTQLLRLFDIQVELETTLGPPPAAGRLVIANHRSAIDIGVLLGTFGGRMVSRADLSGWPLLGAAARAVGTLFVDRQKAQSGAATIRMIKDALRSGDTVLLFPEGTTFAGDEVRPFHAGSFLAVSHTQAEIVPVGLAYSRDSDAAYVDTTFVQHLGRIARSEHTRVAVAVGEPMRAGDDKTKVLAAKCQARVQELVHEARRRVDRQASTAE